jgi:ParB family chromosome partitioning protein
MTTLPTIPDKSSGIKGRLTQTESARLAELEPNSGDNEWYTPERYIEAALEVMGSIDLDPASCELANRTVKAIEIFTEQDNGLTKAWGGNVWMNPPYAQPLIAQFAEKITASVESGSVKQSCVLVNNATETAWFQRMMEKASAVCFPAGRVRFLDQDGKPGAPLQGQAIIYFGNHLAEFEQAFSPLGFVTLNTGRTVA